MINKTKYLVYLIVAVVIIAIIGVGYSLYSKYKVPTKKVTTFEECLAAGYPVSQTNPPQCTSPDGRVFVSTTANYQWKNFTDTIQGVTFEYPVQIPTKYIRSVDWPPKVRVLNSNFTCANAGSLITPAGKTESRTIAGNTYCVTEESEGAAGSVYTQYAYLATKNNKVVSLTFTLQAVQCDNYDGPQKTACKNERSTFDIDSLVDRIFSTMMVAPVADYKNSTYTIEGQSVALVNGYSEVAIAPDSASKIVTQYFGNEAVGDLNGDGLPDVAFILTQTSGGSGTFYYVVVALKTATGYQGTNAISLGDRISPQTTEITNGQLIVNYADRKPGEPMSAQPSVAVSKYLKIQGSTLVEIPKTAGLSQRCGGNTTTAPVCSSGLHCAPVPGTNLPFGDVGGICVSN